ncbi:MAG TPA: outer membrane protein assembly factor BamA [Gammaproteobacteria bacterium]|nr:outer membrane protein assembly factor BamA [Gammaproteobacteria bacterium]
MRFAFSIRSRGALVALVLAAAGFAPATQAQELPAGNPYPFVVRDFRVEGAQRISEGTIYNYLPINIGDTVTEQRVAEAVRALYGTGFFQDVELRGDGSTLVIAVLERPSIEEFTFDGNKDIKDDDLQKVLKQAGLTKGKTFDRSVLEELTRSLTEEYYSRGKYAAKITPTVENLPDNRVRVSIKIEEGQRAKIREINIVGNKTYPDKDILDQFELKTGHFLSFIKNDDRYSKESLEGDLEKLRSYYMDRGFADFRIDDTQVAISPDKRDIFITIGITEGDRYTFGDVKLAGEMVVPEQDLRALILARKGATFSQQLLTVTEKAMNLRLGEDGYAFSKVQSVPDIHEDTKTVDVTFFVDPQNRVYVRRINFTGSDSVEDEVFRREMRQMEGGYLSNDLLDRSKVRIQRLPYVKNVDYETVPVSGSPDQVDVNYKIEEGLPGQFGGSIGYSQAQGIILGGQFAHSNFLGTGNRVAVNLSGGAYQKIYDVNFTNPYRTINELSRSISLTYQDITQFTSYTSDFSTTTLGGGINWSYPISETQYFNFGFQYQSAELLTSAFSSQQAVDWVRNNGHPFSVPDTSSVFGTDVKTLELAVGWLLDSRNRTLFPDAGSRLRFSLNSTVPGSEVEYYVASLDATKYFKMPGRWRFRINSELAYGEALGDTTALPPFRNFYAGGPGSVRGFKQSKLGPLDSLNNPYGGNLLVTSQFEILMPTPAKFQNSARLSLFYDIGNVFSTGGVQFYDKLGDPVDYGFDYNRLKRSVGVSVEWLAPLGLLSFSYAVPLNEDKETDRFYGDDVERFQFNVGQAF